MDTRPEKHTRASNGRQTAQQKWRPEDITPTGIRFTGEHKGCGMDILASHGTVSAYPDFVFITTRAQIDRAAPTLRAAGVDYQLNDDLAGTRFTREDARHLAEREGWYTPDAQGKKPQGARGSRTQDNG
jgi:hypothetical protein